MAVHELKPIRRNLHGHFSRDMEPVLTIDSGDLVIYHQIPDAAWNLRPRRFEEDKPLRFEPRDPEKDSGHCLCGPIAIRGAQAGQTLEIQIQSLIPGDRGWTAAAGWPHEVHKRLGIADPPEATFFWELFPDSRTAANQLGYKVRLNPFLGVMGMPMDNTERQPTPPPRRTGGNLDCKELVAGTSLFLPIEVAGGLFSAGDGHAAQGDGEVCVTAIECPIDRAELRFVLRPDMHIRMPRARNSHQWITLGVHEDLDEAVFLALEEMFDLIGGEFGLDRKNSLALASVVVDVRVTQIVNGVKGAHLVLEDGAIRTS